MSSHSKFSNDNMSNWFEHITLNTGYAKVLFFDGFTRRNKQQNKTKVQ